MRPFKPYAVPTGIRPVRTIEYYEGPLLIELKDAEGATWLMFWVDCDTTHNRWLLLRRRPLAIEAYLHRNLDRRRLVLGSRYFHPGLKQPSDEPVVAVDTDVKGHWIRAWLIDVLPEEYIPEPFTFFDPETSNAEP